jgi:hypothetical protein
MEWIAFIRPKEAVGPIKIVETSDPRQTTKEMEQGSPIDLYYIGAISATDYPLTWWIAELSSWHVRDNWYLPEAQVLCKIEDALKGNLPLPSKSAHLPDQVPKSKRKPSFPPKHKPGWPEHVDPYPSVQPDAADPDQSVDLVSRILKKS